MNRPLPALADEELDRRLARTVSDLMELGAREIGLDDLVRETAVSQALYEALGIDCSDLVSYVGGAQIRFVPYAVGDPPFLACSDTDFVPGVVRAGVLYVPDTLLPRVEAKSPDLPDVGSAVLALLLIRRWLDIRTDGAVQRLLHPSLADAFGDDPGDDPGEADGQGAQDDPPAASQAEAANAAAADDQRTRLTTALARVEDALVRAKVPYVQPPLSYALLGVFVEALYETDGDDNALEVPQGTSRGHFHGSVPQVLSGERTATDYARRLFSLDTLLARSSRNSMDLPIRILDVLVNRFINRTQLADERKKYLIVWYLLRLTRRYPPLGAEIARRLPAERGVRRGVLAHVLSFLHRDPVVAACLRAQGLPRRAPARLRSKREVVEHLGLDLQDEYSARLLEVLQDLYIYEGSVEVMDRDHVIDAWENRKSSRSWKGSLDVTRLLRIADIAADNPLFECASREPGETRVVYHPNQRYLYNSLRRVLGTHYVYRLLTAEVLAWALRQVEFKPLSEGTVMIIKVMRTFRDRDDFERDRGVSDFFETVLPTELARMGDDERVEYLRAVYQCPLEPWELRETPTRMEDMRRLRFIADDEHPR